MSLTTSETPSHAWDKPPFIKTDVRVVVDVDGAVPWRQWMTRQGADQKWIDQLAGAAGGDSVGDWWVFEGTIPWTQWVEIIDVETGDPTC